MASSPLSGSLARTIGRAFSSLFLDATLVRDVFPPPSPDYEAFDPPEPTPTTYTMKAIRNTFGAGLLAASLVRADEVEILILQTSLDTTPQSGDRITISGMGGPWSIVPKDSAGRAAVEADPANATWSCRAKA